MFENSNNSHRERQSINRYESKDVCSPSPPWINDLIGSKKGKLVDIVNNANSNDESITNNLDIKSESFPNSYANPELTSSELNISSNTCLSSKSGSTSIGSTSISPVVSLSNEGSQAFNESQSCQFCLCLQTELSSHCDRESGFDISAETKAVHLHSAGSRVNVPIVRSVSSSVITGRAFSCCGSRCLVSTCVDCCSEHLQTIPEFTSNDSSNDKNKTHRNINGFEYKSSTLKVSDSSEEQIIPGLVAQRKIQFLQRQVSESSFFAHSCHICGKTKALNNENYWNYSQKVKMICEKNRDKSDYNDRNPNENLNHHYEEIMDYNKCQTHPIITNGIDVNQRDDEYELKYGPGIVDKLKHKFMSISIQQQNNYKLKRSSSLENILVDSLHTQQSFPSQLICGKPSEANDLLVPLLGKNGSISVRAITETGNRINGNQISHRLYIQHHNNKNIFNSKSSAIVPLIKRAKSMETLLIQDRDEKDKEIKGRQPMNALNNSNGKKETPLSNQNDLQLNDSVLICDNTGSHKSQNSANSTLIHSNTEMKSVSQLNSNGIDDELPKPDTVKTYKRIFEPTATKTGPELSKTGVNNIINNKSKNFKKSPMNGSASTANVKRKPPVLRATNKSTALKTQPSVNSSPVIKPQSPLPQVIETIPCPTTRTTPSITPSVVGQNDKNNNSNDINKCANTSNLTNTSVRKPPIAPKRASLTLKANPMANPLTGMSAAINKSNKINGSIINTNASKRVQKNQNNYISSIPTEKSVKTKAIDSHKPSIPQTVNGIKEPSDVCPNTQINGKSEPTDCSESSTKKSKVIKPIANIKPFTQNNQINGDFKTETNSNDCQSINGEQNDSDLGHNKTNETSIGENSVTQLDEELIVGNNRLMNKNNNKSNKIDNESNGNNTESPLISDFNCNTNANKDPNDNNKTVAVNPVNDENVSPNTCDIVVDKTTDKNRTNDSNIEDQTMVSQQPAPDVLKPSLLLNSESNRPAKNVNSSLWAQQSKKPTNSSTTTIVFDFRGKDVKSNLAIHPLPFGVVGPKRSIQNGSNDNDDDDNYSGSTEIPLPSGIIFMGENIRIGRGALLLTRNKKLTLQFNDSATKTFEYPSEASLLAEIGISMNSDVLSDENKSEKNNSVITSDSSTSLTSLKTNLALGGTQGGLGSYKPTLIDTPFELGVSRTQKTTGNTDIVNSDSNPTNDSEDSDVVKPANPNETTSWSTSSTASDLLF